MSCTGRCLVIHLLPFELGCNTLPVTRSLPSGLPSPEPVSFASRNAVTVDPECPRLSITIGVGSLAAIVQLLNDVIGAHAPPGRRAARAATWPTHDDT